jgi:alanine racemase
VVSGSPDTSYELPVKPVLSWKTRILQVRDVPAGQPLGYHGAYVTQAPSRIAVIPVGYADGLNRQLSSRGRVIVRHDYASIVGNVTMDLTLLDITGIPGVDVGDEVILLGSSGHHTITAWDLASLAGTIPYEVLCGISDRVPRKYVE